MRLWPFKRKDPEPEPLPEDEPLWVLVDRLLAGRLTWDDRAYIRVCVENWELRRENRELRLEELHRRAAVNAPMVHKPRPVTKPKPVTRNIKRNSATPKKPSRASYMRRYRANRAKLRVVTRDGVVTDGGDAA